MRASGGQDVCAGRCGQPIDLAEPYVSYNRHVEIQRRGRITVRRAEEIEKWHLFCDRKR